jgi:hypothetical protein
MKATFEKKNILGMELEQWKYESCTANFAVGEDWATLYDIQSDDEGKGHATQLLTDARHHYNAIGGKKFGGSVALNDRMKLLYKHLGIEEYAE